MLKVENVACGYGEKNVVNGISFHLHPQECMAILGANGCGKTTLVKAIAGLLPFSGSITACGLDVRTAPRRETARTIALMSQINSVDFDYSVYETVMMGRYAHQRPGLFASAGPQDKQIVAQALAKTGLTDLADRRVTQLSGGQLQRVFLARVFAQQPHIILLDEPTNHLDLKFQIELVQLLNEWAAEENHCVVGVLHDINLALEFANRILLMRNGTAVFEGKASELDLSLLHQVYDTDVRAWMQQSLKRWE